jgi:lysophospholipase L1-like esterase
VLKKGAVVMFVKNNFEKGYVNGTLGKIVDFEEDELHLSDKGYEVFQREVELVLENIVRGEKNEDLCNDSQR